MNVCGQEGPTWCTSLAGGNPEIGATAQPAPKEQVLRTGRGDCKGDQGQGAFFTLPHRLVVAVVPFLSLLFSVEAGNQMQ